VLMVVPEGVGGDKWSILMDRLHADGRRHVYRWSLGKTHTWEFDRTLGAESRGEDYSRVWPLTEQSGVSPTLR
jgi:hypothetical protein